MKEALKLALEALEDPISFAKGKAAITAIKKALANHTEDNLAMVAQPERPQNCGTGFCSCIECLFEPVAWAMLHENGDFIDAINPDEHARIEGEYTVPLYTTSPAQRQLESTTDMMMGLADRLGELPDDIDPRAWEHLLVYAPQRKPQEFVCSTGLCHYRKPLSDEEIWKFWWARPEVQDGEDDSMEAEFVAAVRRVLATHGIKE